MTHFFYQKLLLAFLLMSPSFTYAQVSINGDESAPDPSAMLDVKSTDKGILIPRLTTAQRSGINSPATGLLVFDSSKKSFWFYTGTKWEELVADSNFVESPLQYYANNRVRPNPAVVNEATSDFVFGSPNLAYTFNADYAGRFFFDKSKAAFRAGYEQGWDWDDDNIGLYSIGLGYKPQASGDYAVALGKSQATGEHSFALGDRAQALADHAFSAGTLSITTGQYSASLGAYAQAQGDTAVAIGYSARALGSYSTAIGRNATASGTNSMALGYSVNATGTTAFAFGQSSTASGNTSTAFGFNSEAGGNYATAMGYETAAPSFGETTIGLNPTLYTPNSLSFFSPTDRLFTIGNGVNPGSRSNALTIYKNGRMNINDAYNMPTADGTNGQVMTTDGSGNVAWEDAPSGNSAGSFSYDGSENKIYPDTSQVDVSSADFVFGSTQLAYDADPDHYARFFFDKSKAAFRAGSEYGTNWSEGNTGLYSIGLGQSPQASGDYSVAIGGGTANGEHATTLGWGNQSSGDFSFSTGKNSTASGINSTAIGLFAFAQGDTSFAIGHQAQTMGARSFAIGNNALADGVGSTSIGLQSISMGNYSTAMGYFSTASGFGSISLGAINEASGKFSTALGLGANAPSWGEISIGAYPTTYTPNSTDAFSMSDRILSVGNGLADNARSNVLTIFKDGRVNINDAFTLPILDGNNGQVMTTDGNGNTSWQSIVSPPLSAFGHNGANDLVSPNTNLIDLATDDFVFGSDQLDDDGNADHKARLFFDKSKGAFRAGASDNVSWDAANVGSSSIGLGYNTMASGTYSTAMGNETTASGSNSTAMGSETEASGLASTSAGSNTTASGDYSAAFGRTTEASGTYSISMGFQSIASGNNAIALGRYSESPSYGETTIGIYPKTYTPNSVDQFNANDKIFSIGNGSSLLDRSNALTIYKNGQININDAYTLPTADGSNGQVLKTNGNGNLTWQDEEEQESILEYDAGNHLLSTNPSIINEATADFVFGSPTMEDDGDTDHDRRLFFDKSRAAFRAGAATDDEWDDTNVGNYSTALGRNSRAKGHYSMAFGNENNSLGVSSTAMGLDNTAKSYGETVMGIYADTSGMANSANSIHPDDKLFVIGNGTGPAWYERYNALTILKNGNVGIGYGSLVPQYTLQVGSSGNGTSARANAWLVFSDKRLKRDFEKIEKPLDMLSQLNGYYYFWKKDMSDQSRQFGVIAQEVEAVLPEIVSIDDEGIRSVDYAKLTALLIEVNKAQQKEIEALKEKVGKIDLLEERLAKLEKGGASNSSVDVSGK